MGRIASDFAIESGHWYLSDGSPYYTVKAKDGTDRFTNIRDARKVGARPGVTTIIKEANKFALNSWMQKQVMLAALTLPRRDGELDEDFCDRVLLDSKAQAKKAAEEGQALHTAIERSIQGKPYDERFKGHISNVWQSLNDLNINLSDGEAERSFCHPLGFGGKGDWHSKSQVVVLDFKSKEKIEDGKQYAYDEQLMQLAACAMGFGFRGWPKPINVFVGIKDQKVLVVDWDKLEPDGMKRGWKMFTCLLEYWVERNRYPVEQALGGEG